jgi:hypothetical protein
MRARSSAAAVCAAALLAGAVAADGDVAGPAAARKELPRGGTRILPDYRVVAFFGAPQHRNLGVLGIGPPSRAARKLRKQSRPYRRGGRPIMPAFELIATIALASPGPGGKYRARQSERVIRRYLRAARRARALLVLDIQPGRSDFVTEVKALRKWLRQPDVSVALDPEWNMGRRGIPGRRIGSVRAKVVNRVAGYLSRTVRKGRLPQKLLIVHQFTDGMIRGKRTLRSRPGVALTVNVDGFGGRSVKVQKYRHFTRRRDRLYDGIKLFYEEDTNILTPRHVLRLRPRPDVVIYE